MKLLHHAPVSASTLRLPFNAMTSDPLEACEASSTPTTPLVDVLGLRNVSFD